jgi:hypothetical protein
MDDVVLRDLIPALKPELDQVKATEGTINDYKNVTAEVLLLCGDDSGVAALVSVVRCGGRVAPAAQRERGQSGLVSFDRLRTHTTIMAW